MSAAEPSSPEPPGPSEPESPGPAEPEQPAKKFKFPTAFTVLAIVLGLVWIASFFVPAGAYKLNKDGEPEPGHYYRLPGCSAPGPQPPDPPGQGAGRERPIAGRCAVRAGHDRGRGGATVRRHGVHVPLQAALGRAA